MDVILLLSFLCAFGTLMWVLISTLLVIDESKIKGEDNTFVEISMLKTWGGVSRIILFSTCLILISQDSFHYLFIEGWKTPTSFIKIFQILITISSYVLLIKKSNDYYRITRTKN